MKGGILTVVFVFSTLIFSIPLHARKYRSQKRADPKTVSIFAVWADTGQAVANQNEDLALVPASTAKLITTYCALKKLGEDHQFETRFFTESALADGTISNLWVQGQGDPSLVSEYLPLIVQNLKSVGLTKIAGNIYIDSSFFANGDYPGRQENNPRPYNAQTSATALNFNSVAVTIEQSGKKLQVTLLPDTPYFTLRNKVRLGGKRTRIYLNTEPKTGGEIITVGGNFPWQAGKSTTYRSIQNPPLFFGHALATALQEGGVAFDGEIAQKKVGGKIYLLKYLSKPLNEIVADINKFSNNFMAEQLTKYLGAKALGAPATTPKGVRVLKSCLAEAGVSPNEVFLENGSGLSYNNKISAKNLVKILLAGFNNSKIRGALIDSLSIPGAEGTMRSRHFVKNLEGVLKAKTGSLFKISSLAGYIQASNGKTIAFAILMNNLNMGLGASHRFQDSLVYEWSQLLTKP